MADSGLKMCRAALLFGGVGLVAGVIFNVVFGSPPWDAGGLLGGAISGLLLLASS